jgi:WD40 repeat protein
VRDLAFSPDGTLLASVGRDLRLWSVDAAGSPAVPLLESEIGKLDAFSFSPSSKRLVCGDDHGWLRLWDPRAGRALARFRGHHAPLAWCSFSPSDDLLATLDGAGILKIWRVETQELMARFTTTAAVRIHSWSSDGRFIALGCEDGTLYLLEPTGPPFQAA